MQYIKLKKELNKESQEAGWFFAHQTRRYGAPMLAFSKLFLFLSLPSLCQWQVQTVRVLLLPQTVQRSSARRWTEIPSKKSCGGCVQFKAWHPPESGDQFAHKAVWDLQKMHPAGSGLMPSAEGHQPGLTWCLQPKGTIHSRMEVAQVREVTLLQVSSCCPVEWSPQTNVPEGILHDVWDSSKQK